MHFICVYTVLDSFSLIPDIDSIITYKRITGVIINPGDFIYYYNFLFYFIFNTTI